MNKRYPLALAGLVPFLLNACATTPSPEQQADMAASARAYSGVLIKQLGGELKQALTAQGPEAAIGICKDKAPKIAAQLSQRSGMQITRVSAKNRNPNGAPDAWEAQALSQLEQRLAQGEKPETLEYYAVVDTPQGKAFRYLKGLPVQPVCVTCHGAAEGIPEGVKARLADEYPDDKATGYAPGMLRGAVSIQKPL